jgi:hypothetical protein
MRPDVISLDPSTEMYFDLALAAVRYVKGKVNAGSANRAEDKKQREDNNFQELGQTQLDRQRQASRFLAHEASQPRFGPQGKLPEIIDKDDKICYFAEITESSGFGNCGEQAGVAYRYLRRFPVAGLVFINLVNGNHEFVVLGAGPLVIEGSSFTLDEVKKALGDGAIVCDPWLSGGRAFRVRTHWEWGIDQMLKQAAPNADRSQVKVGCLARCAHKYRSTKEEEWIVKERAKMETAKKKENDDQCSIQ